MVLTEEAETAMAAWGGVATRQAHVFWGGWGGCTRMRVCYDMHLPYMSLQYGENLWNLLAGVVLTKTNGHIICKN